MNGDSISRRQLKIIHDELIAYRANVSGDLAICAFDLRTLPKDLYPSDPIYRRANYIVSNMLMSSLNTIQDSYKLICYEVYRGDMFVYGSFDFDYNKYIRFHRIISGIEPYINAAMSLTACKNWGIPAWLVKLERYVFVLNNRYEKLDKEDLSSILSPRFPLSGCEIVMPSEICVFEKYVQPASALVQPKYIKIKQRDYSDLYRVLSVYQNANVECAMVLWGHSIIENAISFINSILADDERLAGFLNDDIVGNSPGTHAVNGKINKEDLTYFDSWQPTRFFKGDGVAINADTLRKAASNGYIRRRMPDGKKQWEYMLEDVYERWPDETKHILDYWRSKKRK
ncbi:hypothetical protein [Poriferisphaera sp. WC338]|uniref:hypothetical protein n=1 Tax=Poriferisphaera sp. WC338 TaxID=3425129 RepID=UPI003D81BB75